MENIKSIISSRNLSSLYTAMGMSNGTLPDLEKRFSEISTLLDKNDNSPIKVKTEGSLLGGGEEKTITFKDYKENPDEYAPLTSGRVQTLQANENRLIKEQTDALLNTTIKAKDDETGEVFDITIAQRMDFEEKKAAAEAKKEEEEERRREVINKQNTPYGRTNSPFTFFKM